MTNRLADLSRVLVALLIAGALVAPVAESSAQQEAPGSGLPSPSAILSIQDENLLVLEVRIEKRTTGHGLIAYQQPEGVLLPLGELCAILELAIMVDPDQGTAQGWIVDEKRTFGLNMPARTLTRQGNLEPLPPASVGKDDNDIYVLSTLLEQWLPVDLEINLPRMHVMISPRETLPFQSRLKRDEQRALWLASKGKGVRTYPMQMAPYRMWSWPLVDATLGFNTGRRNSTRRLALESYADLAGLSSNLFLSHVGGKDHSQTIARVKAGRWNPEGRLLGPASATRYEFGDLFISRVPLISISRQGLGAMVSNQSLNRSREFNNTEIQGDAPPGWEAELYINGALYDFQVIGESGQYLFSGVPLIVGNNTFRTVLRGPRGETREVVKNANVSPEMTDVGQLKYRATVVRDGNGLLTSPPARADAQMNTWNQQLELAYALSPSHALVANFSRLSGVGSSETFSSLTSHNSLGKVYTETILATSLQGGSAFSVGARTRISGHNLFALYNANDNYRAEALDGRSYLSREAILRSSGSLFRMGKSHMFYNLSATGRNYADSELQAEKELKFHLATGVKRFQLAHNLTYRQREWELNKEDMTQGTQLVRTQLGPVSVGGELNYELAPAQFWSTGASVNWFRTDRVQISARASHFFKPVFGNDNVGADLTVFFEKCSLGVNYSYFNSGGSAVGVTLGTFLTKDNRSNSWTVYHQRMAGRSVASVRAFIDRDGDKVFGEGDEPLPGVGFLNHTAWRKVRTNDGGIVLLTGLQVNRAQTIELNEATVADPFLVPLSRGVNVLGHPGSFVDVEFPFSFVGEMEGMVFEANNLDIPVRHVGLEILDSEGNRVQSTVAEFDGYYYFPRIFPGEYKLAVIASTINATRYEVPEPVEFTIPAQGGFITGPDILLERSKAIPVPPPVLAVENQALEEGEPVVMVAEAAKPPVAEPAQEEPKVEVARSEAKPKAESKPDSTPNMPVAKEAPVEMASAPGSGQVQKQAVPGASRLRLAALAAAPDFDEELTLSLIFEILYRNSLWPDEPVQ
jgi:hypothetical protein